MLFNNSPTLNGQRLCRYPYWEIFQATGPGLCGRANIYHGGSNSKLDVLIALSQAV